MKKILFIVLLFPLISIQAQQYTIRGSVKDIQSDKNLGYANIRVLGSMVGTAANLEGKYELKLKPGNYNLIASYIGYYSDTVTVELNKDIPDLDFQLKETNLPLPEVVVHPGENPAIEIIKKAIEKKKEREKKLNSYEFEAYTKGIVRTEKDFAARGNTVSLGVGVNDTTELKITGILENQSKGYFLKPDFYKEIILARKQSANFPPSINIVTGGRLIQNFYEGDINFFGSDMPGPLSNNALDYYYFYIEKVLALDNKKIYKIYMATESSVDPGFEGSVYIADITYDLIKVDLQLNRAANIGGIFDTINVFQQFGSYDDIYMPVDYRVFLKANILGIARIGFELNTVLYDYKINPPLSSKDFTKAIVTVLPDADKKDSLYWASSQTIPNTLEEEEAYERIDSLSRAPVTFWDRFSFLSTSTYLTDNFATNGTLNLYHFNRVEGHALKLGLYVDDYLDQRLNSQLEFSYGFSDKKFKTDFSAEYLLGDYRTYSITFNAYKKLKILFGDSDSYTDLTATLLALLNKEEFRDYYYSNGFDFKLEGEIFPVLKLSAGFINTTDNTAKINSNFSFFRKDRIYRSNPPVYETKINAVTAGFVLDFRRYIENGYYRRRTSLGRSNIIFSGNVTYSNTDFLNSGLDFTVYRFYINSFIRTFHSANIRMRLFGMYNNGTLPYQALYALPGNINAISKNFTFRTLRINEVFGDRVATFNLEYDLHDEIFRFMNIPGLRSWELNLNLFFNTAVTRIGDNSRAILSTAVNSFEKPFYEIGFGIGQGIIPMQLEFSWKLNHRGSNNFVISLNTFAF
jgi:hypothetical protein